MKALVVYFSRADENYFGGSMRYIEKGNTEVVAEYIKQITKAVHYLLCYISMWSK